MRSFVLVGIAVLLAAAQIDQTKATAYFHEAAVLCAREGGHLWGVSLCGPMVFADPVSKEIATNQPVPSAPRPAALGYANAAMAWGDTRWTTIVWPMIDGMDEHQRARMMVHELFHRVQLQLGLLVNDGENGHLDTLNGRYWMRLEWRALARALGVVGTARATAVRDALAFRAARHAAFPGSADNERRIEVNEGLAQYTGTVVAAASPAEAVADAIRQLAAAEQAQTFVREFAYPLGAAYGLLLDDASPGWTRHVTASDDLSALLMIAANVAPTADAAAAAAGYGGPAVRAQETVREAEQLARVAAYRRRFVEGPVLVVPNGRASSFVSIGITAIPDAGFIYPTFRTSSEWGSLVAAEVLLSTDRTTVTLAGPFITDGATLSGDGWTLTIAEGWVVRPGPRAGDFVIRVR